MLDSLFKNADKIREKCIDDIYAENKEKTRLELEELARASAALSVEIKKAAVKSTLTVTNCSSARGEPPRDPALVKKCNDLVNMHNAIIDRMNTLSGWNDNGRPKNDAKNDAKSIESAITPPCPSKEKMAELRQAAIFNRKLFKTWEYCRNAMIDGM